MKKMIGLLLGAALVVQSAGCGTIMYPERKGQKDGRIDAGVAVLDGIGLLFFIIPGVIAFAVDFSNGTIYLPKSGKGAEKGGLKRLLFDAKKSPSASVEEIVRRETGYAVRLDQEDLQVTRLGSLDEMRARFGE